jgi:hypothetical protein
MKKKSNPKSFKMQSFLLPKAANMSKEFIFWGITPKPEIGIL